MAGRSSARVYGIAGITLPVVGVVRAARPLAGVLLLSGYILGNRWPLAAVPRLWWSVGLLVMVPLAAAAVLLLERRVQDFLHGARGEQVVARCLARLGEEYAVFHGVVLPGIRRRGGDIDHVVVGPEGVFAIETLNWRRGGRLENGSLLVGDDPPSYDPLARARRLAAILQGFLARNGGPALEVTPVVCFAANNFSGGLAGVNGVVVCNVNRLPDIFDRVAVHPLTPEERRRMERALRDWVASGGTD